MSINRAEQKLEDVPAVVIASLQKQLRELKTTTQKLGADALSVVAFPDSGPLLAGPLSLASGGAGTFSSTFNPDSSILTMWNFAISVNVDVDDSDHRWPDGASLTSEQRKMSLSNWLDWGDSTDLTNLRVYKVRVFNNGVDPHDYYLRIRAYLPLLAVT